MIGQVSFNSNFDLMIGRIRGVTSQYHAMLEKASSGKQVNSAADDPGAYSRILQGRRENQTFVDYQKGIGTALQEMQTADSVLSTANDRLTRARELAVLGSSETYNVDDMQAMAEEVVAIRDDLVQIGNTRFNDRYIFAGHLYDEPAYDDLGAYQGDDGVRSYIAGEDYTLEVNLTGDEVFGTAAGGVDIFATLDALETALNAGNATAIQATLTDLDQGLSQLNHARSIYGTRANQATELQSFYDLRSVAVTERVSQEEDIDAAEAYTDLAQISSAMQATLQVAANVSRLSLLDYM